MPNIFAVIIAVAVWFGLAVFVARLAQSYGRPAGTWLLLALLFNPLLMAVVLIILGDPGRAAALIEKEDRIRMRHPECTDTREAALNEMQCPTCGAEVNVVTGDGLHTADNEPWLLFCDKCEAKIEPDV